MQQSISIIEAKLNAVGGTSQSGRPQSIVDQAASYNNYRAAHAEAVQREEKVNNVVLSGLPEFPGSIDNFSEFRSDMGHNPDLMLVLDSLKPLGINSNDVCSVFRMGSRKSFAETVATGPDQTIAYGSQSSGPDNANVRSTSPRLLKIICNNSNVKRCLFTLRGKTALAESSKSNLQLPFTPRIAARGDLTILQRQMRSFAYKVSEFISSRDESVDLCVRFPHPSSNPLIYRRVNNDRSRPTFSLYGDPSDHHFLTAQGFSDTLPPPITSK